MFTATDMTPHERYGFDYDIDQWYEKCKDFTFKTVFLPITQTEAKVIIKQYEINILKQNDKIFGEEDYEIYKKLEERIEDTLQANFYDEEEDAAVAFVRMSSRSPKDASFTSDEFKQILKRKLMEKGRMLPEDVQNEEFISFFEAQIETLHFDSAEKILDIHCASTRVYEDLQRALEFKSHDWTIHFVFRELAKNHDIALEFRGFVYKRSLNALSQYYDPLYFRKLHKFKDIYLESIKQFFESVKDQIPWENCVMDFLITEAEDLDEPTLDDLQVQVVEFNPLNRFTGAALFSWTHDTPLFCAEKPFEFRIRTEPLPVLSNANIPYSSGGDAKTAIQLNLMDVDPTIINQYQDLLGMLENFMDDDFERINANLRYVLQKTSKETFLQYFQTVESEEKSEPE